ncbi:hypothetical protein ACQEVF_56960 [Nonomuraea polychroma]|uniref:hypothetical protein n=1 Tax=Nonomuraea polychroma TaxID=46176 RepID=UPI003D8EE14F
MSPDPKQPSSEPDEPARRGHRRTPEQLARFGWKPGDIEIIPPQPVAQRIQDAEEIIRAQKKVIAALREGEEQPDQVAALEEMEQSYGDTYGTDLSAASG